MCRCVVNFFPGVDKAVGADYIGAYQWRAGEERAWCPKALVTLVPAVSPVFIY